MGCFNLQCGYSGLEIHSDDEVQLFLMTNNAFGDGFIGFTCYPQDCYTLLGPGIPARYNEYGWYELDEKNLIAEHLQRQITKLLIPLTEEQCSRDRGGKKQAMILIRDADANKEDRPLLSWDIIGDMIHDGELFVKNQYGEKAQVYVSKFAVHKELYDNINARDIKSGWGDKAEMYRDKIRTKVQELRKPVDKSVLAELEGLPYDTLTADQKERLNAFWRAEMAFDRDEIRMEHVNDRYSLAKLAKYESLDGEQLTEDELVDAYHGLVALQHAMTQNNKMYLPQGPGHQCYNFEDEIAYHEEILAYVKKRHKEQMIDWGEWDENGEPYKYNENGDPIDDE